ncbi:MAG: carboxypeptidase regulatory-like domain-containing protein [Planctomycetaceae bacterium]|nr:carboxypeptidase regulatory-like domain-containing protein [Planctomycetaceae bacterium]
MNQASPVFVLAILCLFSGCGQEKATKPKTAKVSGVVVYKGDPVEGASVKFFADESLKSPRLGGGTTNENGEFTISTFGIDDGAVVGNHVVTVTKISSGGEPPMTQDESNALAPIVINPKAVIKQELPQKYASEKSSPLKVEVIADENNVFKLELVD